MGALLNLGDELVVVHDFHSIQQAVDNDWEVSTASSITNGLLNLSAQKQFIPGWFWETGGTIRMRIRPKNTDATFRRFFFVGRSANFFVSLTVQGSTGATILEIRNGAGNKFYSASQSLVIGEFNELVFIFDPATPSWTSYLNGSSKVTDSVAGSAGLGAYDTNYNLIKVGAISGGSTVTNMDTDFIEIYQSQWAAEEVSDAFNKNTYQEIDAGKALLYIPSRTHYDDGGQKTKNLGTAGDMVVGDGTSSSTFPSQSVGVSRGFYYDGVDYLQIADAPALRPTEFTISLHCRSVQTAGKVLFEKDVLNGFSVQRLGTGEITLAVGGGIILTSLSSTTLSDGTWHSVMLVFRGSNDGDIYTDGELDTATVSAGVPSYSAGPVYIGGRAAAVGYSGDLIGNMYPFALTLRQARWIHEEFLKKINK